MSFIQFSQWSKSNQLFTKKCSSLIKEDADTQDNFPYYREKNNYDNKQKGLYPREGNACTHL